MCFTDTTKHRHQPGHSGVNVQNSMQGILHSLWAHTSTQSCCTWISASSRAPSKSPPEATVVYRDVPCPAEPINSAFKSLLLPTVKQEFRGEKSAPHHRAGVVKLLWWVYFFVSDCSSAESSRRWSWAARNLEPHSSKERLWRTDKNFLHFLPRT